ncbi:MAG TPA: methyltransferase [Sporichthya sp.]|nr:methyltransferase [Sporichthya sp.]
MSYLPDHPEARTDIERIREAFVAADYTTDGVSDLLGPVAEAALARHETVPARRVARADGSALAALVRLFLLQDTLPEAQAPLPVGAAIRLGLLESSAGELRARLDARPHDDAFLVVSDLGTGLDGNVRPVGADHVLGVGGASVSLAELTVRHPVGRALDLGTGCGVQALHLTRHARHVLATDVLPRALQLAALGAALSGVEVELRAGGLFDPVAGEKFDLIVSNPPFVIGAGEARRTYRDGGLVGDELGRRLVAAAPGHLNPGGWCQLLANWVHRPGEDWRDRVGAWLPADCDGWALQREVLDPAAYVSLWLHDAGDIASRNYLDRYDAWLSALEADDVEGIGFGWITLRRTEGPGIHRVEDWPHSVDAPLGPHVAEAFERMAWLGAQDDAALLAARLCVADDVSQELIGEPGAEDPRHVVLRQSSGLRRARTVDTAAAALVGACTGEAPAGILIDAVATLLDEESAEVRARLLPLVHDLVAEGYLLAADALPTVGIR